MKERKNKRNGISLIVLVITIIVMIILASAIIITLSNNNIINKANEAVDKTNEASSKYLSELKLSEREVEKAQGASQVKDTNPGILREEENVYYIESIEDLVEFSNEVNGGNTYEGKTVKLTKLLDFNSDKSYIDPNTTTFGDINGDDKTEALKIELTTGKGFTPIGKTEENPFKGIFDGDGTEIRNLYINETDEGAYSGFFGWMTDGTIKNLGITGNITTNVGSCIAGLAGSVYAETKDAYVQNCYNKANIKTDLVGSTNCALAGLINAAYGTEETYIKIQDCYNLGTINSKGTSESTASAGGLVNYLEHGIVDRCYNKGNIILSTGKIDKVGGLVAWANGYLIIYNPIIVMNSYNMGNIEVSASTSIGGLIGNMQNSKAYNSYNIGNIIGENCRRVAGLIGSASSLVAENMYNLGELTAKTDAYEIMPSGTISCVKLYYIEGKIPVSSDKAVESIAKPLSYIKSQAFVDELNANCEGHDDWAKWKLGVNGYPVLDI